VKGICSFPWQKVNAPLSVFVLSHPDIIINFKNQGNDAFKSGCLLRDRFLKDATNEIVKKNYQMSFRDAVTFYTKALLQSPVPFELEATCLVNRAASHLELGKNGETMASVAGALSTSFPFSFLNRKLSIVSDRLLKSTGGH
jgi:hypothetical protein